MPEELTDADQELLAEAERTIRDHYESGRHHTGAALRTASGAIFTGISLKARTGVADVHAEPIAVARAMLAGDAELETVVAVQPADEAAWTESERNEHPTQIVSACGQCRELLLAFGPELSILVAGEDGPEKWRLSELQSGI